MKNYNDVFELKEEIARKIDAAYSKGYDTAYEDRKIEEEFDEDRAKAIEEAYQKGLDDAWKYAEKITGCTYARRTEILGAYAHPCDVFAVFTPQGVIEKINEYEEKHKKMCDNCTHVEECNVRDITTSDCIGYVPKSEEIKVGDEVYLASLAGCYPRMVLSFYTDEQGRKAVTVLPQGAVDTQPVSNLQKTGRHFDIQSILNKMKEEN